MNHVTGKYSALNTIKLKSKLPTICQVVDPNAPNRSYDQHCATNKYSNVLTFVNFKHLTDVVVVYSSDPDIR